MQIKIKYCGGCNSAYDRVSFAKELCDKISKLISEGTLFIHNDEKVEKGLILCGCSSCCADRIDTKSEAKIWYIVGPDLLDYAYVPQARIIDKLVDKLIQEGRM